MTLKTDFDGLPAFERLAAKVGREAALDCAIHLGRLGDILASAGEMPEDTEATQRQTRPTSSQVNRAVSPKGA